MRAAVTLLVLVIAAPFVRTPFMQRAVHIAIGVLAAWLVIKLALRLALVWFASRSRYSQRRAREEATREQADWFGQTGLDEAIERELPRYLRRELHEFIDTPEGLKAGQLRYLGLLGDEHGQAHFWQLPARPEWSEPTFAHVEIAPDGSFTMGWGDRQPTAAPSP